MAGGTYSDWAPYYNYVQAGMVDGNYVNGAFTLVAAGPPRLANIGGAVALGGALQGSGGKANQLVFPIGILQNLGISYQRNWARIFELGSERSYYVSGRTFGQISLGRVYYHGPSMLRVLYAYYRDTLGPTTVQALFDNEGINAQANPHDVFIPPGYENIFLNLGSDLFGQPIGLLYYIRDISLKTLGAVYMECCVIPQWGLSVDSQGVLLQEQCALQFERMVPVTVDAVKLVTSSNAGGSNATYPNMPGS
jgi:hypothetical protein